MQSTDRLRARVLGIPGVVAAIGGLSVESEVTQILRSAEPVHSGAIAVLRRRAQCWAEGHEVEHVVASLLAAFRRNDVPEAVRYSVLRTVCNGWVTSRRLSQERRSCQMECGAEDGDWLKHYLFCPRVLAMARRHLRLHLAAVRVRGICGIFGYLGIAGDRGYRVAIHVDATLMAYNKLRHGHGGGASGLYAGKLNELSRRHPAVGAVVHRCAVERRRAG